MPHAGPGPQPQAPASQTSARLKAHVLQAPPRVPHKASVGGVVQLPLWQHPLAHELESQPQEPEEQR